MRRRIRNFAIVAAASLLVFAIAGIWVVRTEWFRNYIKQKIVSETEERTGGRVEVGLFSFDWRHLDAVITDFVIHGMEPAGSAPFVRVGRVEAKLRLFPGPHHLWDLTYLGVDRPEANLIVFPDGHTNVPAPKQKSESKTTALETVVDLAVGRFELTRGALAVNAQKQNVSLRGENLRAQLAYQVLKQGYQGQVSMEPLYTISGRNTPVRFALTLPVTIGRDSLNIQGGQISTPASRLAIDASIENSKTSVHVTGKVALADLRNTGAPIEADPRAVDVNANVTIGNRGIEISGLRLGLGKSSVEASGNLRDGSLKFQAKLALDDLNSLVLVAARPGGIADLKGTAQLDASDAYLINGNVDARNVSFLTEGRRIGGINLDSKMRLDPKRWELDDLRLRALGGELTGTASLEDFSRYRVNVNLRGLDLGTVAEAMGETNLPYSGAASGAIQAAGDLKAPGVRSINASSRISIAPGARGVPVSGRLNADYRGASDQITVHDSSLALPHTQITLSGSVGDHLDIVLKTRNLNDLLIHAPVVLESGGEATLTATVTGHLTTPHLVAHLSANRFAVENRHFDTVTLDANASNSGASVSNGSLVRGAMAAQFTGSLGLQDWKATSRAPIAGDITIRNGDLADIGVLAGIPAADYSGALSATAHLSGTVGDPLGSANLTASNGAIHGQPFDQIQAQVTLADQLITVPSAQISAGAGRANLTAEFHHPRDSFTTGDLHARVQTSPVSMAQLHALQQRLPNAAGEVQVQAEVTATLSQTPIDLTLTSINADASAHALRLDGQDYGDVTASARTQRQSVRYELASNFAGSKMNVNGTTQLTPGFPTDASATIGNLPVERVLALAKRTDIPVKGKLSGTVRFNGTVKNPQGNVDLDLANAVLYDEPIDHVRATARYVAQTLDVPRVEVDLGKSRVTLSGKYDSAGNLQFHVNTSRLDLTTIRNVQNRRPGLAGVLQMDVQGTASIGKTGTPVQVHSLDANLAANGLADHGANFGDLKFTAKTSGGRVDLTLNSNLAGSSIDGRGTAELTAGYPLNANLTFSNLAWTRLHTLLDSSGDIPGFEAVADGQVAVNGPIEKLDNLRGSMKLTRVKLTPAGQRNIVIQNDGPIAISVDHGVARIDSLHLTGPQADLQAHGTASLNGQALDFSINGHGDLAAIRQLNREVVSSGTVTLTASVRGSTMKPLVNGRLEFHDASAIYTGFSNGISKANGVVQFNGDSAVVQNLTAESGGGKVTLGGFLAFRDVMRFGLRANATGVRIRPQDGVSLAMDANLDLTGTMYASVASGTVTIERVTYTPRSDLGSILARAAPPVDVAASPSPFLDNMKLDIRVRTSSGTTVRTSLAQSLQADADLRIRGTASQPGVLGRIDVNQGQLVFFGSTYTVNTGTIGFYNPMRIDPILNLSLETQTKGVDVVLRVTGPVDNMKLSYTSDPPLQFEEIAELLGSGKLPTSDPNLLANQPAPATQSTAQMGESAVVGKTLGDPVSQQLKQIFGVSEFHVDPVFAGGSAAPGAQLSLQQRVGDNVTFTYATDVNDPNTEIIRIEWALNHEWSAIGMRDQNGIVSIRFTYKKQFR